MKKIINSSLILGFISLLLISCNKEIKPKPDGFLSLEYPEAKYQTNKESKAFTFDQNQISFIENENNNAFKIQYPELKATIYINYKPVENNLNNLLKDAQKLTYDHTIKADAITEQLYINPEKRIYGMLYEVEGNAATNVQFYVTDSISHFIVGSAYFYAKPNYDSILPAAAYIKDDMRRIMESISWK